MGVTYWSRSDGSPRQEFGAALSVSPAWLALPTLPPAAGTTTWLCTQPAQVKPIVSVTIRTELSMTAVLVERLCCENGRYTHEYGPHTFRLHAQLLRARVLKDCSS